MSYTTPQYIVDDSSGTFSNCLTFVVNIGKASIAPALALLTAGLKLQLHKNVELQLVLCPVWLVNLVRQWLIDMYLSYSLLTTLSTPRKTAVRSIAPMFIGSLRNK